MGLVVRRVLACGPNAVTAKLHNRMPVILDQSDWPKWLGEEPPRLSRWRCCAPALTIG
jgi:putative SOS response-associated peptidase YedK